MRLESILIGIVALSACSTSKEATKGAPGLTGEMQKKLEACCGDLDKSQSELAQCEKQANKEVTSSEFYKRRMQAYERIAKKLHSIFATGEATLHSMVAVLEDPGREFLIAGYTDDVPVKKDNRTYQDNWELSALRALAVVRYLSQQGLSPKSIGAAGFGKYHPVATNTTETGRSENRRIEVVFLPTVEELPKLPPPTRL
jgi:outer membrane protein OmpA-like peptidoglycan-associated protein